MTVKEDEEKERIIDRRIDHFNYLCVPFGSRDVQTAIEFLDNFGLNEQSLYDAMEGYIDSTGVKFNDVDICYIAYDYILQMVRNDIDSILSFDFCNDTNGEIYTAGNYMCTSYDYDSLVIEELKDRLKQATEEQREQLTETSDHFIKWCEYVDIDIEEIWK